MQIVFYSINSSLILKFHLRYENIRQFAFCIVLLVLIVYLFSLKIGCIACFILVWIWNFTQIMSIGQILIYHKHNFASYNNL